jgi:hypothetical protein
MWSGIYLFSLKTNYQRSCLIFHDDTKAESSNAEWKVGKYNPAADGNEFWNHSKQEIKNNHVHTNVSVRKNHIFKANCPFWANY